MGESSGELSMFAMVRCGHELPIDNVFARNDGCLVRDGTCCIARDISERRRLSCIEYRLQTATCEAQKEYTRLELSDWSLLRHRTAPDALAGPHSSQAALALQLRPSGVGMCLVQASQTPQDAQRQMWTYLTGAGCGSKIDATNAIKIYSRRDGSACRHVHNHRALVTRMLS